MEKSLWYIFYIHEKQFAVAAACEVEDFKFFIYGYMV